MKSTFKGLLKVDFVFLIGTRIGLMELIFTGFHEKQKTSLAETYEAFSKHQNPPTIKQEDQVPEV